MTDTTLYRTWAPHFRTEVRQRGRAYFEQGRVEALRPRPGEVFRAAVQGTRPYTVVITADRARPAASCTCPTYGRGAYCKHIWAALLKLNQEGEPAEAASTPEGEAPANGEVPSPVPRFTAPPPLPKARRRTSPDVAGGPCEAASRTAGAGGQRLQPEWMRRLALLRHSRTEVQRRSDILLAAPQVYYEVQLDPSLAEHSLIVALRQRRPTRNGWGRLKPLRISSGTVGELLDATDRELAGFILGAQRVEDGEAQRPWSTPGSCSTFALPRSAQRTLLQRMIATGRCLLDTADPDKPLRWDAHPRPWVPVLVGQMRDTQLHVHVELRRDTDRMDLQTPLLILAGPDDSGVLIHGGMAAPYDAQGADRWVRTFRDDLRHGEGIQPLIIPGPDIERFIDRLYRLPHLPAMDLPETIARQAESAAPVPHLTLTSPRAEAATTGGGGGGSVAQAAHVTATGRGAGTGAGASNGAGQGMVEAEVYFDYAGHRIGIEDPGEFIVVDAAGDEPVTGPDAADEADQDHSSSPAAAGPAPEPATFTAPPALIPPWQDQVQAEEGQSQANGLPGSQADASATPAQRPRLIRRDHQRERQAILRLGALGLRPAAAEESRNLLLPPRQVPEVVGQLLAEGWVVVADRRALRRPGGVRLSVRSGIDWFELRGQVSYETEEGEQHVDLQHILEAARSGRSMIQLGDGTEGVLPEQWLREHGLLAAIGQEHEDHLRFNASQAALLDALLAEQDLLSVDETFEAARQRMRSFQRIEPTQPGPGFRGQLRHYQEEGLGWLLFLRWFGMGGILADDMGLGKTIQVLALLQKLRQDDGQDRPAGPILVVAPRSVVYNWVDEAARFTPEVRVLNYSGTDRAEQRRRFQDHDLVVTSYGLLRRDAAHLRQFDFDTVVLDEAQAIKNPASQGAKAARLIKARHRLALTGTPVENHLGDLWSIFEFLNPGMLGSNTRFAQMLRGGGNEVGSVDAARQAGRALRPFILRRTKTQVLDELPEKTEQTLLCEMEPAQRRLYESLRKHYRGTLLNQIDAAAAGGAGGGGVGRSAMLVLEALLRLRQAACHPGLVDDKRRGDPAAKLDVLLAQLEELVDEGHKALVFSQFTSLLALVREALESRGMAYEYLDGQTRDRRGPVQRFQNDPACPVFLISLKAGGLGLNLTAADYVFILDPWWNPAVEQQAIDRAYRIGQMRHVTAYRLICQNTVEQRILELQQHKRQLAAAIVEGEQSLLRSLSRDDLEKLLS